MSQQNTHQQIIRPPAVAGMFYPDNPTELQAMVTEMLTQAQDLENDINQPVAVIAPHAGYIYSGPVAATAYRYIGRFHQAIKRVILLGPSHRVPSVLCRLRHQPRT